ncbi:hypothetical protein Esi_0162_0052 [Ectocarpus siliculosus]|uniref:Uncharacterized protein n=1 Tax=Ectocarpus siliculosus TaxID=2880 RepID=D7FLZ9_ECTSI|nr:hypothetical protein Esi_0162_0052 [Ectocarpus siliculosus]|eukprot:CBJ29824.1 hypothetical protein Esi_0162_0052 [Ectocarpus siliculosus]
MVSAYYLSRGHAQYFGGRISEAHADYRRALELDPANVEAGRLCRQFDSKGKLTAPSGPSRQSSKKERQLSVAAPSSNMESCKTSTVPLPLSVPLSSWASSSSSSSTWSLLPPSRSSRGPQPPTPASPIPISDRSLRTTTTASSSASDTSMASGICCKQCGSKAGGCETSEPCTRQVTIPGRTESGGALKDICRWKPKRHRRVRRRGQGNRLPKVDTRPPKEPEWGESAISWAKASDNGVKRVFKERFGGVPPRDERLWGMLRTSPTKRWSSTGAGDGSSVASSRKAPPV